MSELVVQRPAPSRAPSRVLSVLALLGLGVWALPTLLIGVRQVVNAVNAVHDLSAVRAPGALAGPGLPSTDAAVTLGVALFVLWLLSLNAVLVAGVIGVVDIALVHRSWQRCMVFAVVCVAAPVAALVVSQIGGGDLVHPETSYLRAAAPGLGMSLIAVLTMAAAWWLLGLGGRRTTRPPAS